MHSFSNLRMIAGVTQNDYAPGSTLKLRASLKEYNLPVEKRANVRAEVEYPDHSHTTLALAEVQPGIFEAAMVGSMLGIYRFTVVANGVTYKGASFTREQMLNAAIFRGQDIPPQGIAPDPTHNEQLCQLLECLIKDESVQKFLDRHGLDVKSIAKCVYGFCHRPQRQPGRATITSLGLHQASVEPKWSDLLGMAGALRKKGPAR